MFSFCTALTVPPELPATTLAGACYMYMFNECSSLAEAPELPATTMENACYSRMFRNCTSLVEPPDLPATTLAAGCYGCMFEGCTSLTSIDLSTVTSIPVDYDALQYICYGCSALTTVHLENLQIANSMVEAFKNCTSLVRIDLHNVTTIMSSSGSEYGM